MTWIDCARRITYRACVGLMGYIDVLVELVVEPSGNGDVDAIQVLPACPRGLIFYEFVGWPTAR